MRKKLAQKNAGFTLLELLASLIIVCILTVLSTMLYLNHIYRARRIDAIQTLLSMELAQENYRANNSQYGTLAQVWNGVTTTTGGYYTLSITNVSATGYTLTAQAVSPQTGDTENGTSCSTLTLTVSSGTETKSPSTCWLNN